MAKCVRCGKRGLFLQVDMNGHCPECAEKFRQERLEQQRRVEAAQIAASRVRYKSIPFYNITLSDLPRKRQRGFPDIKTSNITPKGCYDRFVVFDTETTGLTPSKDRIVELAAIRFCDGVPIEMFTTLIDPQCPIPPEASAVNQITNDMVERAPLISQVLPSFEEFIGNDILIAHNLEFDLKFLFYSGSTLLDTPRKYIDTLAQAQSLLRKPKRRYFPPEDQYDDGHWDIDWDCDYDVDNHKLETLCDYYGIVRPYEHQAAADALVTGDLFMALVDEKQRRYE